jgi:hypothetical protein
MNLLNSRTAYFGSDSVVFGSEAESLLQYSSIMLNILSTIFYGQRLERNVVVRESIHLGRLVSVRRRFILLSRIDYELGSLIKLIER